jgi:hypothetical protein
MHVSLLIGTCRMHAIDALHDDGGRMTFDIS